jgi:signal transduction histidine kinase
MINIQLKRIYDILNRRVKEQTSQIVSVDMVNKHINNLARSINDCLKAEENLRRKSMQEEKKFKELMTNISHDLRTPLTAIKGYQQILQKETLTEEQQSKLAIAIKHTDILGKLIEHFFEYTYLVNHTQVCNMEKINFTNLVSEYLVSSIPMFEEHGQELIYNDSIQTHVMADKEFLGRIIQNLIRNCIQHTASTIHVSIITYETREKGCMAGVSFSNEIQENQIIDVERLFDRFYTADYARKQSTGLGLAIVKLLTEQMNGEVSAELKDGILDIRVFFPRV